MKPVAIFRHYAGEGPGYFATFLERHSIPWQLICIDEGEPPPADIDAYSGLAFMGGPMSVNDDLPWIAPVLALIRTAVARNIPVVGHCLGGQLMAKALGGVISRNPVKEIGWGAVSTLPAAADWLPGVAGFNSFHWHGETFSIPSGAERILESAYCPNQAFVLGPHLALQCHVEMSADMIAEWGQNGAREIERAGAIPSVQTGPAMLVDVARKLDDLHAMADLIYSKWISALPKN